ncbi:MAG: Methylthioribulose-1-phosphate dehydratase [Watsoniomyces obsoletus]|nr:MAG: Methylthioribulose-1-phosphate dehydratase [Watsoniomyces obsoletus]
MSQDSDLYDDDIDDDEFVLAARSFESAGDVLGEVKSPENTSARGVKRRRLDGDSVDWNGNGGVNTKERSLGPEFRDNQNLRPGVQGNGQTILSKSNGHTPRGGRGGLSTGPVKTTPQVASSTSRNQVGSVSKGGISNWASGNSNSSRQNITPTTAGQSQLEGRAASARRGSALASSFNSREGYSDQDSSSESGFEAPARVPRHDTKRPGGGGTGTGLNSPEVVRRGPIGGRNVNPSDSFSSFSMDEVQLPGLTAHRASQSTPARPRNTNSQGNLRQMTLFGAPAPAPGGTGQANQRARATPILNEPPTHHELNTVALRTWVYPTNLGSIRDYQFNITQKGLFNNLLVALPTGLGKTFIAATIMLNWYRWTKQSQIVFVAPTKPLVAQQVEACFKIAGIPRSQTTLLTGAIPPGLRAEEWSTKRVFFMTPQTLINDLKTGVCDPKRIVCVVVDEAHRATGSYAYVEVIKFLRRFNNSFRVLALTATPGSSVEAVQQVIDGLDISRVEIRTEESLDIRQYVQTRNIETAVFDHSDEILRLRELFSKAIQPVLDQLNQANAYWVRDPMSLTAYGLTQARQQWVNSDVGRRANQGLKGKMHTIFALLASLAHSITLLNFHGVGPFYHYLSNFRGETEKGSKYRKQILESPPFVTLMNQARAWLNTSNFVGHPKLEYLQQVVLNHFMDAENNPRGPDGSQTPTRIMIFAQYRDSADEIVRVLKQNEPMVRAHVFVGQAGTKGSSGMSQKSQLDLLKQFREGKYNTVVATSVGEEGLDIGEVDLILCFDSSSSPIRMLQRMGRTGRKRAGNIVLLLMRGKEEDSYTKAKDAYEKMQQMIADGDRFEFHDDLSPRIIPRGIHPTVDKRAVDIPIENSQGDLPEPRRRGKVPKRPPKKFHMPDGVETGFVRASRLGGGRRQEDMEDEEESLPELLETELTELPALEDVLLTTTEERELYQRYQFVHGGDNVQMITMPNLDAHPDHQRSKRRTKHVPHGRSSISMIGMLNKMHGMDETRVAQFEKGLHPDDREMVLRKPSAPSVTPARKAMRKSHRDTLGTSSTSWTPLNSSITSRQQPSSSSRLQSSSVGIQRSDDSMADFIVDDDEEDGGAEELTSSAAQPSLQSSQPSKPFYKSPRRGAPPGMSQEELPDVSVLVSSKRKKGSAKRGIGYHEHESPKGRRSRKNRRAIIEESDEE